MHTCILAADTFISFLKPIQRFPNTSIKGSMLYADQIGYGQDFPWSCHWASSHAEHEDKWRFNQRSWHDRNQVWLTAHPVCAEVNNAMQQLTGVRCTVQHKWAAQRLDHGKAREIYWQTRVNYQSFFNLETHSVTTAVCEALRQESMLAHKRGHRKRCRREDLDVNGAAKSVATQLQETRPSCHTQYINCQSEQWNNTDRSTTVVSKAHHSRNSEWPVGRDLPNRTLQLSPSNLRSQICYEAC